MNEQIACKSEYIIKWLRYLTCIGIISILNSFINLLPFVPAALSTWISWGIMAAMYISMLKLAPANERFGKAGIFRGAMLACSLITTFLFASRFLPLAASVCSVIAVYQEFHGHAELLENKNAKLSQKWRRLFLWEFIAGLVLSFVSTFAVLILVTMDLDASRIASIVIGVLKIPTWILDVVYLCYIHKMICIFKEDSEV